MTQQDGLSVSPASPEESFRITPSMLLSLRQTKPWARFLAVLGFVGVFFMIIGGSLNMLGLTKIDHTHPAFQLVIMVGLANILFGVLYFFPVLFLLKYASSIGKLVNGGGSDEMEKALSYQKSFWKFIGILTLITFFLGISAAIIIPQIARFTG